MPNPNEQITAEEFGKRVVELCLKSGAHGLPRRTRDRHIVLKSVALTLDHRAIMTPRELDCAVDRWRRMIAQRLEVDRATVRRWMVDEGYLRRSPRGELYTLKTCAWRPGFADEVDDLDVVGVALHGICDIEQRRFERFPQYNSRAGRKIAAARLIAERLLEGELDWRVAGNKLRNLFERGDPFLSDLGYFQCSYRELHDDEGLTFLFAREFLVKTAEWVRWVERR